MKMENSPEWAEEGVGEDEEGVEALEEQYSILF